MKKLLYIFIFIASIVGFNACKDNEFLEQEDQDSLSGENTFTTEAQLDNVLVAAYQHCRAIFAQSSSYYEYFKGLGTDMYTSASSRSTSGFNDYSTLTTSTYTYELLYKTFYKLVNKANIVIYNADNNDIDWESDESRDYLYAQAYTFIGIAYLNLGEIWGGVPLVKELVTSAKYDYTRSTRVETYEYAIEMLEAALDGLPETTTSGGRIVKAVAQHYLSEAYLALGIAQEDEGVDATSSYTKSAEYASDVIDGGTYALMTNRFGDRAEEEDKDVYWDLFRDGNVNYQDGNTECIWAYQFGYDEYMDDDGEAVLDYPRVFSPVLRAVTGMTGEDETVGGRGIAGMVPTMYLCKTIWQDDDGDIRNSEANIQRNFTYNDEDYTDLYGTTCTEEDMYANASATGYGYPVFWKFADDEKIYGSSDGVGSYEYSYIFRDAYAIRLSETYLLRAEAYYRLGQSSDAAADINTVRERSGAADISSSDVDIDYILAERARELYGEEHRWNTLLRMSGTVFYDHYQAYNYDEDYSWTVDFRSTLTTKINLWPIPQSVIDTNYGATIEQNTGW